MSGYRGGSPQLVEGDHEVDPSLSRTLIHLSGVVAVLAVVAALIWVVLSWLNRSATAYLSTHPGALWAMSALLFGGLAAYLAGREYARRSEAVRTSAWRAARTSRADSVTAPAECRKCLVLREENRALRAEIEATRLQVSPPDGLGEAPVVSTPGPEVLDVIEVFEVVEVPGEQELRETT
jgi:hypothetical protein